MKIYAHCPREWMELHELGRRMFGLFIGHTKREYLEERWDDGDYSHFIEEPQVLAEYDVHPEITDHWIHDELMLEDGWHRYNKLSDIGRSPDFFVTEREREDAMMILKAAVERVNKYFYEYSERYGESPAKEKKKSKDRSKEYHRRIKPHLMSLMIDCLTSVRKDAKILVMSDAYGRASEYLLDKGYTNITTDTENNDTLTGVDKIVLDRLNVVTQATGKFDVIIANPPYQKGKNSNFYVEFVDDASDLLNPGGQIIFITPNRFILPHTPAAKSILGNFQVQKMWIDVNKYFPNVGTKIGMFSAIKSNGHTGTTKVEFADGNEIEIDPRTLSIPSKIPTAEGVALLQQFVEEHKDTPRFDFVNKQPTHTNNFVYVCRQWKSEGGRLYFDAEVGPSDKPRDGKYIITEKPEEVCDYLRSSEIGPRLHKLFGDQMNIWPFLWDFIPNCDTDYKSSTKSTGTIFDL